MVACSCSCPLQAGRIPADLALPSDIQTVWLQGNYLEGGWPTGRGMQGFL